ncbi:unnamed protein product [Mytilus edulis]|uniref:CUB domain-containing protein n=1 Tax=Mytilus edulis TaxID=6550 RepID=A0A8S3R0C7_MYTED|nr:unnamed protein product [Mytilus edulis]
MHAKIVFSNVKIGGNNSYSRIFKNNSFLLPGSNLTWSKDSITRMLDQSDPSGSNYTSFINIVWITIVFVLNACTCADYTRILNANDVNICKQPLYYDMDTLYIIRAQNKIYSRNCELRFLDWNDAIVGQPCVSLCVRVHNNSMKSCDFRMTYYDGLGDLNAQSFDCHSFPPILWCSRKNEIKIEFTELKKYKGSGYDITLEVTSYCSHDEDSTKGTDSGIKRKGESYNEEKRKEEKRTRDTVIIAGSLVSTVSFILVICWVTYCCWKRQHPSDSSSSNRAHTAGSATSSSTPKSEGSGQRPCQYSACATTGTTTQQYYQPQGRPFLQQKPTHPYVNAYNYPRSNADRYVQFPDSGIDMKESFVQYKSQPPTRDVHFQDEHFLSMDHMEGGHSYDADDDSPDKDITPPVPPRPNLTQHQGRQYFI